MHTFFTGIGTVAAVVSTLLALNMIKPLGGPGEAVNRVVREHVIERVTGVPTLVVPGDAEGHENDNPHQPGVNVGGSENSDLAEVPDVVGLSQGDAVAQVKAAGFRPEVRESPWQEPGEAVGTVLDTFPPPSMRIPKKSVVTLTVNGG